MQGSIIPLSGAETTYGYARVYYTTAWCRDWVWICKGLLYHSLVQRLGMDMQGSIIPLSGAETGYGYARVYYRYCLVLKV